MSDKTVLSWEFKNPWDDETKAARWRREKREARWRREEEREKRAKERKMLWATGAPRRVLEALAGTWHQTPATEAVDAMGTDWCVVLSGDPGLGKTFAAVAWLAARARDGVFATAADVTREGAYGEALARAIGARYLVLDDLGTEYLDAKGYAASVIDGLIDARYRGKRPTVITTNLDADEFRARYDGRITDRLQHEGRFVQLGGASLRRTR